VARTKNKSSSRSRSKPKRTREPIQWSRLAHRAGNFAFVALVLAIFIGWSLGVGPLKSRVMAGQEAPAVPRIAWPALGGPFEGTWLPASSQRQLTQIVHANASDNLFDQASLERTREALHRTGWFVHPPTVRRGRDNVVEIEGEWRTPAAVVRHRERDYMVSGRGELLPIDYPVGGAGPAHRVVMGAEFGPPTRDGRSFAFGEEWIGGDVQAALSLMATLRHHFAGSRVWEQVAGVDVTEHRRNGRLSIVTDRGSRVVWGAAPGAVTPGEQTTVQKLERLAHLANGATGRIDAGARRVEIHGALVYVDERAR